MAFVVEHDLPGWTLAWARLELAAGAEAAADCARREIGAAAAAAGLDAAEPVVAAVRRLFRAAGTDPTRYRPSSEALLRRLLKGDELPAIHPLVDLNNCLSVALRVPSCIMAAGTLEPPVRLRRGHPGEQLDSLRGELDLAGKPLLEDRRGPFGTPITDSRRVAVASGTRSGWLVTYLPAGVLGPEAVARLLCGALASIALTAEAFASGTESPPPGTGP